MKWSLTLLATLALPLVAREAAVADVPPPYACSQTRQIARSPVPIARCPEAAFWQGTLLTGRAGGQNLSRYCVYTRSPNVTQGDLVLPKDWVAEKDCRIIGALAATSLLGTSDLTKRFYESFKNGTGRLADVRGQGNGPSNVIVGVIDSAPKEATDGTAGPSGTYNHGRIVGRVIREMSCPFDPDGSSSTGGCIGLVHSYLGLAYLADGTRDEVHGGTHGTPTDLASAIFDFVNDASNEARSQRKVINLSLGWDPRWDSKDSASRGPASQAVYDAIAYASCRGVLVVAAAGNANGPADKGPLLPAAWESEPAPSLSTCADLLKGTQYAPEPAGLFLVSAGGVDGLDRRLTIARAGGSPRIAAYSWSVSVPDNEAGLYAGFTGAVTGTSISAAITSGAAAVVWGYDPSLSAREVADLLYETGTPLTTAADYCASPPCGAQRRINLCKAVSAVCAGGNSQCPAVLPTCQTGPAGNPDTGDLNPALANVATAGAPFVTTGSATPCIGAGCGTATETGSGFPWLLPQPPPIICLPCALATRDPVSHKLDVGDFNTNLALSHAPVLLISKEVGASWGSANLQVNFLGGGSTLYLLGASTGVSNYEVPVPLSAPVLTATLNFSVLDPMTGTPVILQKPVLLNYQPTAVPALGWHSWLLGAAMIAAAMVARRRRPS
ncbi:MAG: S8/S53 family peptidase [Deltaproteobacteria bacterium]|nr:S8/S53 family peptidase [Deltaproteobacteria bacterium]